MLAIKKFDYYYYKYLEYNEKKGGICTRKDDFKVNDFKYPVILSCFKGSIICSISNNYYKYIKDDIKNPRNLLEGEYLINRISDKTNENIVVQKMNRMSKIKTFDIDISNVICIGELQKSFFFNSFVHNKDVLYKQMKWDNLKKNSYINGIICDDKIVSLGFVSDINYGGANIVIQTLGEYQNRGYGKQIVEKISRDLLNDGIVPIYWVNEENISSINLAKGIGFEIKAKEIVIKLNNIN